MSDTVKIYEVWDGFGKCRFITKDYSAARKLVQKLYNEDVWSKIHTITSWKCERCSKPVICRSGRSAECRNCKAQYSCTGQRFVDNWRSNPSNYDSDVTDLEGYERQYAGDR